MAASNAIGEQEAGEVPHPTIGFYAFSVDGRSLPDAAGEWRLFLSPLIDVERVYSDATSSFSASAKLYNLGWGLLLQTNSCGLRYGRSNTKARRDDLDHFIFHMPLSGRATFVLGDSIRHLRRLDLAAADLTAPLDVVVAPGGAVSLILPRARLAPLLEDAERLHGRCLASTTPAGALFGRHLLALARWMPGLRVDQARALGEATARLAAICLSTQAARGEAPPATSARPGLGQEVRAHIEAHLHDLRLSPQLLADRFHLSRSHLYRLFDQLGGVHHYIRGRRLRRAFELISRRDSAPRRIGDIAYSLGFADDAHFSRIFRERFGLSPRDTRAAARRGETERLAYDEAAEGGNPLRQWLRELTFA